MWVRRWMVEKREIPRPETDWRKIRVFVVCGGWR